MTKENTNFKVTKAADLLQRRFNDVIREEEQLFFLLNKSSRIDSFSQSFASFIKTNFNIELKTGMNASEILPPSFWKYLKELILKTKQINTVNQVFVVNGTFFNVTVNKLFDNDEVVSYLIKTTDLTQMALKLDELHLKESQYKFITDNLIDVLWIHSVGGGFEFVSKSIFRQRGFEVEEYAKMTLDEIMLPDDVTIAKNIFNTKGFLKYSPDNPLTYLAQYYIKDGGIMIGESITFPIIENNKPVQIFGITRDVTERIRQLRKIQEQKSELETILNNTDEMISSIDRNFNIVTINSANRKRILERYGKEPKIGMNVLDFVDKSTIPTLKEIFNQIIQKRRNHFHHLFKVDSDQGVLFYDTWLRPLSVDNEIFGISIFVNDITQRLLNKKALQDSENRLKRITESSLEGIWEYDYKKNELFLSDRLKKIVKYNGPNQQSSFIEHIKTILPEKAYTYLKDVILKRINKMSNIQFEIPINFDLDETLWLQIKATSSSDRKGNNLLLSGVMIDITNQKKQEAELREAKEKAEEMTRLKSSFLANMSHEIRTPLNAILGVTQILEKEKLPEEILSYLSMQKKSGFRLLETINNILDISRMESGEKQLPDNKQIELNEYIINNIEPFKILANQKKIDIEVIFKKDKIPVFLNVKIFHSVFNNLVGNAIKFTTKGKVSIITDIKGKYATLKVKDTGIGINAKNIKKIFNAFEQESTGSKRKFEGTGLGLAIVKKFVDLTKGKISVASKKGIGSTFTLKLPLFTTKQ